jgi:plastocyanin
MEDAMRRSFGTLVLFTCLASLLVVGLVGCSGGGGSTSGSSPTGGGTVAGGTTITEENFAFNPSTATVKVGDTVTFTNNDSAPHNVKIDGQELGTQNQGESKTWTASKAGTFPFSCVVHPAMTGQITVQ